MRVRVGGGRGPGGAVLVQGGGAVAGAEEGQVGEGSVRPVEEGGEQRRELRGVPLGRRLVEQVLAVLQFAADPGRGAVGGVPFGEVPGEVELGAGASGRGVAAHGQPVQGGARGGRVVEGQHHLEERVPGRVAGRAHGAHHLLEGQLLVGEGGEVRLADAGEQRGEVRVARGVGAQRQGVDEEADEPGERLVGPPGHRRAHDQVVARAEPAQQGGQRGVQHHERAGPAGGGPLQQGPVDGGGHGDGDGAAAPRGPVRAGAVGGRRRLGGGSVEGGPPVRELPRGPPGGRVRGTEQLPLPERVVGVLDGQRCQSGGAARSACGVGVAQVAEEREHRPAVGGDVVEGEDQQVVPVAVGEQAGPQRRFTGQVEGLGVRRGRPGPRQRRHGERYGRGLPHALVRPVRVLGHHRAQALVPLGHVPERGRQGVPVERPGQPQPDRQVVRGPGAAQPLQQPEPPLGRGERYAGGPGPRGTQRRQGRGGAVEGGEQPGRGRVVEEGADRHLGAERLPDPADQPGGQQRVAAEPEEVVVAADRVEPEAGGELRAHPLLVLGARGAARRAGRRGLGEAGGVELAVGGEREPVQHGVEGGHQVVGEGGGEQVADLGGVGAAGPGDQVCGEPALPTRRAGRRHGGVGDAGQGAQRRLDLAGLHPVAPDLHLVVGAPEELQRALGAPPREVPGAVHAGARRAVRVGQEAAGGQAGPSGVPPGDALARQVQLTGGAERHRVQGAVQDVGAGSGDRAADGGGGAGDAGGHRVDRGLRRPVVVEDDQLVVVAEFGPQGVVDGLAAEREDARVVAVAREQPGGEELPQVAGGGLDRVDPPGGEEGGQRLGVAAGGVVGEVQFVPGQHPQHRVPGGVEGDGGGQRHPQSPPERLGRQRVRLPPVVLQQLGQRTVLDHHALGAPGGTGGVDDVRRVVRLRHRRLRHPAVPARHHGGRVDQLQPLVRHRRPGPRHQRHRRRVLEHVRQPVHGVRRVHRQVRRARAQHREQRRDQVGRTLKTDRHPLPGPRPARRQLDRQRPYSRVQFGEGQPLVPAHHGGRPRRPRRLGRELLGQRRQRPALGHRPRAEPHQAGVLRRRDQRQGAEGPLRVLGEGRQHPAERLVVPGEPGLVVPVRVAQQIEAEPTVAVRGVRRHGQVLDRADREVVQGGGGRAEGERVVEGEDVDGRARLRLPYAQPPFPAQLLGRVALVAQHLARLGRRPPGDVGDPVGGRHGQPHRQHLGEHGRRGPRGRGAPPGHRQPQHHFAQTAFAVQADAERRHQEGRPGDPGPLRGRPQPGRLLRPEVPADRPHPARGPPGASPAGAGAPSR
ncbi:hypothetical protein GA0115250_128728 [Streptomyces sp. BvitLS-983]|nr:hypothetical protein GA0115250_128728 [Streptomyces sp. BvitLS-983]